MSELRQKKMSSHLPVLELIFKHSGIKDVFEYGCGLHSTNYFVSHAQSVISVEMNRTEWVEKLKNEIQSDRLHLLYIRGLDAIEYFKSTNKIYDLVFVDGDGPLRRDCAVNAFGLAETIAVHDVNLTWRRARNAGWLKVVVPDGYKVITMDVAFPATTVFTRNQNLFNELKKEKYAYIKE